MSLLNNFWIDQGRGLTNLHRWGVIKSASRLWTWQAIDHATHRQQCVQ